MYEEHTRWLVDRREGKSTRLQRTVLIIGGVRNAMKQGWAACIVKSV